MNINVQIDRIIVDSSAITGSSDWQQQELLSQSISMEIQRQLQAMDHPELLRLQAVGHGSVPTGSAETLGRSIAASIFDGGGMSSGGNNEGSNSHAVE